MIFLRSKPAKRPAAGAWPTTLISKPMIARAISTQAPTATASAIRAPMCSRVPSRMIGTIADSPNMRDCGKP